MLHCGTCFCQSNESNEEGRVGQGRANEPWKTETATIQNRYKTFLIG